MERGREIFRRRRQLGGAANRAHHHRTGFVQVGGGGVEFLLELAVALVGVGEVARVDGGGPFDDVGDGGVHIPLP